MGSDQGGPKWTDVEVAMVLANCEDQRALVRRREDKEAARRVLLTIPDEQLGRVIRECFGTDEKINREATRLG